MSDTSMMDQLDQGIDALLAGAADETAACDPVVAELLAAAAELCALPRADFKAQLKADLLDAAVESTGAWAKAESTGMQGEVQIQSLPLGAKAPDQNNALMAAVNRCATQNQSFSANGKARHHELGLIAAVNRCATENQDLDASHVARSTAGKKHGSDDLIAGGILPTLAGSGSSMFPVQSRSFMASLGAHALMIALLVTSGIWAAQRLPEKPLVTSTLVTDPGSYVFPPAPDRAGGGGGGGDSDPLPASKGNPPRFAREQIAPPAIIVRSEAPKLPAEPTVVGPPAMPFPQTSQMGDPFSRMAGPLSNGPGTGGGIGNGDRGGVGPGTGPGVGDGSLGGIGGGPYVVGHGVSAPRLIYDPEPEYSDEARKQKYQGVVVLRVVVGDDGSPRDISIAQSVGLGLDEKALEAVRQWRFEPGRLNGKAVAVVVHIQVNFRLY
jgi:TonB family protein